MCILQCNVVLYYNKARRSISGTNQQGMNWGWFYVFSENRFPLETKALTFKGQPLLFIWEEKKLKHNLYIIIRVSVCVCVCVTLPILPKSRHVFTNLSIVLTFFYQSSVDVKFFTNWSVLLSLATKFSCLGASWDLAGQWPVVTLTFTICPVNCCTIRQVTCQISNGCTARWLIVGYSCSSEVKAIHFGVKLYLLH